MSVEIKVPMLPESIAEAQVAVLHKKEGEDVSEGEVIAELETDKVMLEVVATCEGVLTSINVSENDSVNADTVLAVIKEQSTQGKESIIDTAAVSEQSVQQASVQQKDIPASPSVRREIQEHNVDVDKIQASGRGGRILSEDLKVSQTRRVKMSSMRAMIGKRLVEAQHSSAMLTTFNEVNMAPIIALRTEHQEAFKEKYGVKLGFMSFFVQASVHALKNFPEVNASVDGSDILYYEDANIGIAVSTERGLVVPVLKKAQEMNYADIELGIRAYANKAREGKIALSDMENGTFTITNGGVFGSMLSTPILNMPQSAILGMHAIQNVLLLKMMLL